MAERTAQDASRLRLRMVHHISRVARLGNTRLQFREVERATVDRFDGLERKHLVQTAICNMLAKTLQAIAPAH